MIFPCASQIQNQPHRLLISTWLQILITLSGVFYTGKIWMFKPFSGTMKQRIQRVSGGFAPGHPPGLCCGPDGGLKAPPAVFDGTFSAISFYAIVKSPGKNHKLSWKSPRKMCSKFRMNPVIDLVHHFMCKIWLCVPPDFSEEDVHWLCTTAINDLQCRSMATVLRIECQK